MRVFTIDTMHQDYYEDRSNEGMKGVFTFKLMEDNQTVNEHVIKIHIRINEYDKQSYARSWHWNETECKWTNLLNLIPSKLQGNKLRGRAHGRALVNADAEELQMRIMELLFGYDRKADESEIERLIEEESVC